jgi:tight adherence protein B
MNEAFFQSKGFLVLAVFVFVSLFTFVWMLISLLVKPGGLRQRVKKRLKEIESPGLVPAAETLLKKNNQEESLLDRSLQKFQPLQHLQLLMLRAGVIWKLGTYLAVVAVLVSLGLAGGFFKWGWLGGLGGAAIGLLLPYKYLTLKKKSRVNKFEKQFPEALDLLARGLKAGHAFPAGLRQVANEMPDPLGSEFYIIYQEFSHGLDLERSLDNLRYRVDLKDLGFFTTAVTIQRETGGNLTDILGKISVLTRERFTLRNQIKALTAEGRLSGIILILLPPVIGIFMYFLNPQYVSVLFEHPTGRMMSLVALAFQFLGIMFIRKIVNIKV